jgi:uncharacterized protein YaaQ
MLYLDLAIGGMRKMNQFPLDQLALLMVSGSQTEVLLKQLSGEGFRFTQINSTGGFLQEAAICLLVGFSHERLPVFLEIVRNTCRAYRRYIPTQGLMPAEQGSLPMVEAQMGGASVFMMNVERFEQI